MYPGAKANALEDITFKAEPGKTTAIIGSTGCGSQRSLILFQDCMMLQEEALLLMVMI